MATWRKNQVTAALRRAAMYVWDVNGAPAPLATTFTGAELQVRRGGTSWTNATGTLTNTGIDGHWVYEATQAETNFDGTEFEIKIEKTGYSRALTLVQMADDNASILQHELESGVTVEQWMRAQLRGEVAPFTRDPGTGRIVHRDIANTKDSHEGTITASGRSAIVIHDLD
jgi:hypothetical protein